MYNSIWMAIKLILRTNNGHTSIRSSNTTCRIPPLHIHILLLGRTAIESGYNNCFSIIHRILGHLSDSPVLEPFVILRVISFRYLLRIELDGSILSILYLFHI